VEEKERTGIEKRTTKNKIALFKRQRTQLALLTAM
jgi:hypothetical protein